MEAFSTIGVLRETLILLKCQIEIGSVILLGLGQQKENSPRRPELLDLRVKCRHDGRKMDTRFETYFSIQTFGEAPHSRLSHGVRN